MERNGRLIRLGVFLLIVAIIAASGLALAYLDSPPPTPEPNYPMFDPAVTVPERTEASGEVDIDPQVSDGVVLIDAARTNRFFHDDIEPLISGINQAGWEVRFLTPEMTLEAALEDADAFVVIDPGQAFGPTQVDAVRTFVDDGGRLVMVSDPSRFEVDMFGAQEFRNLMNPLAMEFDMQFGAGYLFNLEDNDGNYKHIHVTGGDGAPNLVEVDAVAHLATWIVASDGEPFLVAEPAVEQSSSDQVDRYPIAVVDGNVLAVGDTSFVRSGTYNVGDNEQVLSEIIRFLVDG